MKTIPRYFWSHLLVLGALLLTVQPQSFAQGQGNGRDLLLTCSLDQTAGNGASKLLDPMTPHVLALSLDSPGGSLMASPGFIAADLRPRDNLSVAIQFPGEPGICGLSAQLFFVVDGTGISPSMTPGSYLVGQNGIDVLIALPNLAPLLPLSVWIQGAAFDPSSASGVAFTRSVRLDTTFLDTETDVTVTNYNTGTYLGYGTEAADLNADGSAEVILGLPGADPSFVSNAGEVRILWGPNQQSTTVLTAPTLQTEAWFGTTVRAFDVNGDAHPDLLIGAREETVNSLVSAGAVYVFFGPSFTTSVRVVEPNPEAFARFGHAVTATDWNDDGVNDLVVGAPKALAFGLPQGGQVYIFDGAGGALLAELHSAAPEALSKFGYSLSGADLNGDGRGDLVVGIPYDDLVGSNDNTGAVAVFESPSTTPIMLTQPLDIGALLGCSVDTADMNGDGIMDIVAAAEFDNGLLSLQGAVHIFLGPQFTVSNVIYSPEPEALGGFGSDVAVGDLNHDGYLDLVVGSFYSDVNGLSNAGECFGILGPNFDQWETLTASDPGSGALAGRRVAAGDVDGDGFDDIVFSATTASPLGNTHEGATYIVR